MPAKAELERLLAQRGFAATLARPVRDRDEVPDETGVAVPLGGITELVAARAAAAQNDGPEGFAAIGAGAGLTSWALRAAAAACGVEGADQAPAAVAWIDGSDSLDPESAARAGVRLEQLLWVQGGGTPLPALLEAAHLLIHSGGFRLVTLDLLDRPARERPMPRAAWFRLQRALTRCQRTALLVLARQPLSGTCADQVLALRREAAVWDEQAAPLLTGARVRVQAVQSRRAASGGPRPPGSAGTADMRLDLELPA